MARTAMQMPGQRSLIDFGGLASALSGRAGAHGSLTRPIEGDDLTARAVAFAGLAALAGLPMLLLASMLFSAPFAVPAAIALGYLATSYALTSHHPRSAAAINMLVLTALVAWSLSCVLTGQGSARAELAAALLAPAFAAAPAMARFAILPRQDAAMRAALSNTACLDQLAPREAVLVVRRDGTLLSATRGARAALRMGDDAGGRDVGRSFGLLDRPKLSGAVARCRPDETIELTLEGAGGQGGARQTASVSVIEGGAVSIRLGSVRLDTPFAPALSENVRVGEAEAVTRAACEVGEVVAFAISRCRPTAYAQVAAVTSEIEPDMLADCEPQLCLRIVRLMIDTALPKGGQCARLHFSGRRVKTVALLQLMVTQDGDRAADPSIEGQPRALVALEEAVEMAGGTVMIDGDDEETRISVRLDAVASPETNEGKAGELR